MWFGKPPRVVIEILPRRRREFIRQGRADEDVRADADVIAGGVEAFLHHLGAEQ